MDRKNFRRGTHKFVMLSRVLKKLLNFHRFVAYNVTTYATRPTSVAVYFVSTRIQSDRNPRKWDPNDTEL